MESTQAKEMSMMHYTEVFEAVVTSLLVASHQPEGVTLKVKCVIAIKKRITTIIKMISIHFIYRRDS